MIDDPIEDTLDRWDRESDEGALADQRRRAACQKLAAIRTRVEETIPALLADLLRIQAELRAERSALQRDLGAPDGAGSLAPLEDWRARAAEDSIRDALDAIGREVR